MWANTDEDHLFCHRPWDDEWHIHAATIVINEGEVGTKWISSRFERKSELLTLTQPI